jgi:hypothetical protein
MNEYIKTELQQIKKTNEERNDKFFSWLRNIISISVGFLGLLISLKSVKKTDFITSMFFIITIFLIALGILCGVILLYSEIHTLHKLRLSQQKEIQKVLDGKNNNIVLKWINRHWIFDVCEKICFVSYFLSVISLIIYCVLNEIY